MFAFLQLSMGHLQIRLFPNTYFHSPSAHRPFFCRVPRDYVQHHLESLLEDNVVDNVDSIYRVEAANLASTSQNGVDFQKFSTPGLLLQLARDNASSVHMVTECTVRRIARQVGVYAHKSVSLRSLCEEITT